MSYFVYLLGKKMIANPLVRFCKGCVALAKLSYLILLLLRNTPIWKSARAGYCFLFLNTLKGLVIDQRQSSSNFFKNNTPPTN